jgi:hypothetical protein
MLMAGGGNVPPLLPAQEEFRTITSDCGGKLRAPSGIPTGGPPMRGPLLGSGGPLMGSGGPPRKSCIGDPLSAGGSPAAWTTGRGGCPLGSLAGIGSGGGGGPLLSSTPPRKSCVSGGGGPLLLLGCSPPRNSSGGAPLLISPPALVRKSCGAGGLLLGGSPPRKSGGGGCPRA